MNILNIIPTPQFAQVKNLCGNNSLVKKISSYYFNDELEPILKNAISFLPNTLSPGSADSPLVLSLSPAKSDEEWFSHRNATEQGYILRGDDERVTIIAKTQTGLAYGITTLIQLPELVGEFEVKDYPDFRYRANKWLLWAETEVWSYDFGDGIDAFRARILKKLDLCLKYKINMIFFDALGPDTERSPHYKELMLECNRAARERGIRLIFAAYTMGYGISGHPFGKLFGKIHKTRLSYPDGEIYECLGTLRHSKRLNNGIPFVVSREFGCCLSNEALMEEKLKELTRFVREVEPGALYLHNMDSYIIHQNLWLARCEACRKKWPSDEILAKDGMAGAFAYFFDKLNGQLQKIHSDSYDASRDLLIFNISPGYTEYHVDDTDMASALDFWEKVREYSTVKKNVYPLFREQYYNKDSNTLRLNDAKFDFGVIAFCGGDGFYSDDLFPTTSLFHKMMQGAEIMITCSGHAFSEPLQLFNAEYMWNSSNSALYNDNFPKDFESFTPLFETARAGGYRPSEIFAADGVIDTICRKLYGEDADVMSEFFRLRGENGECPAPYPCNKEIETHGSMGLFPFCWDMEWDIEKRRTYTKKLSQILLVSKRGADILACGKGEDARIYHRLLSLNLPVLSAIYEYVLLYGEMEEYFSSRAQDKNELSQKIAALSDIIKSERSSFSKTPYVFADALGGALARRTEIIENLIYDLSLMKKSLNEDQRIPSDRIERSGGTWW